MAKQLTIQECYDELIELLNIYFYQKTDEDDKQRILKEVKLNIEYLAKLKADKMARAEARRADREARKLGIRR